MEIFLLAAGLWSTKQFTVQQRDFFFHSPIHLFQSSSLIYNGCQVTYKHELNYCDFVLWLKK